jgi:hypothetical protein
MRDAPVTDQELNEAKSFIVGSFPLRVDSSAKLANVLAQVELYNLGLDYFTQYPRAIEKVAKGRCPTRRQAVSRPPTLRLGRRRIDREGQSQTIAGHCPATWSRRPRIPWFPRRR